MRINWIELRNKKTGMTLKKAQFDAINCLSGEEVEAIPFIFDAILGAAQFAQGEIGHGFSDVICRINFHANHHEYLWYAKNTTDETGRIIVDEEELYDADNQMLLRRSFQECSYQGFEQLPAINLEKSMLYLFNASDTPAQITAAFSHVFYYRPHQETNDEILTQLKSLPHGMAVLLDGTYLAEPLDLSPLATARKDLQIIATHCLAEGSSPRLVDCKGKMIGVK